MGIQAENHLAQKAAEERKPTAEEHALAVRVLTGVGGGLVHVTRDELAALLAEHRLRVKKHVIEEEGYDTTQDVEKRRTLAIRISKVEADLAEKTAECDRLSRALGQAIINVKSVINDSTAEMQRLRTVAPPEYTEVVKINERLHAENKRLQAALDQYEAMRQALANMPHAVVHELPQLPPVVSQPIKVDKL